MTQRFNTAKPVQASLYSGEFGERNSNWYPFSLINLLGLTD